MQTSLKLCFMGITVALAGCSFPYRPPETQPVINYEASVVTTVAGSVRGYWNGPAAEAKFMSMRGLAVDASGSLFVNDLGNIGSTPYYRIRKVDPAGTVSNLAGTTMGETDGPLAQARFSVPLGLASAGERLYIADSNNNRIRVITGEATASTLAGGVQGYADGPALEARFFMPRDVAVDRDGNVYVADQSSVRKITPSGTVSTLAGGPSPLLQTPGSSTGKPFVDPQGLGMDANGNLLVADRSRGILRITPSGEVSKVAGPSDYRMWHVDGPVAQARFSSAEDVAADASGNIFVADGSTVRKISPDGIVTTIAGSYGLDAPKQEQGEGAKVRLGQVTSIVVDASGSIYVTNGYRISKIRLN